MMRLPAPAKSQPVRTEQIILFRVSGQLFAVSSASVKEVRSVDTLSGAAKEIAQAGLRKVRHIVQRGEHSLYVVNGAMHFGLPAFAPALVFVLRRTRTALLVDGIEKMTTMTRLQALPQAFCNDERDWYRGVTAIDQTVVPVVKPEGFLTPDELLLLDSSLEPRDSAPQSGGFAGGPRSLLEGLDATFTAGLPRELRQATPDPPADSVGGPASVVGSFGSPAPPDSGERLATSETAVSGSDRAATFGLTGAGSESTDTIDPASFPP